MTRTAFTLGNIMQKEAVQSVSLDVNFASTRFPNYTIDANSVLIEPKEDPKMPSVKEIVTKETAQLLEQQQRLSVRDLAKRFEKGLATAAKLSNETKLREVVSLDRHVLLKKLRDILEILRNRVVGRNKDIVDEAISMVEGLAVRLSQTEGELFLEKEEVKKLAVFLKKATEDAKKVVEEERALAHAEINNARAAVQRIEQALHEQEQLSKTGEKQDLEELRKEVQEARRIKMLHQPSRVMDMEHELQALRTQLAEKSMHAIQLHKELEMIKRFEGNKSHSYELEGLECLGSCLQIISRIENSAHISNSSIQWYRIQLEDGKKELISGATKTIYAPEPCDVGRFLQAELVARGERIALRTTAPIDPAAGLGSYVEVLVRKNETEFNVVVLQMNGSDHHSSSLHVFHVGKLRLKLSKGKTTKAKEFYSSSMQLCGVRGGGSAAAQSLFWHAKKGLSFTIAFESTRERNAAIMLARRFAYDCNVRFD
ncbi:hypothetical protein AXF42_Ash003503 [Apostasia shenzhenica]|uniref:Stomatal closure-related actin-binding protein 1 n=1 Tax=Apostasia shenzhenica TaxID=1088818 RepID=A0A2I0BGE4_9ASPA|nr:hypothetical protein AXF42_Ash003503 [Apostasia shenzhenica]